MKHKVFSFLSVLAALALLSGCSTPNRNRAGLWGSNDPGMTGGAIVEGEMPLLSDPGMLPDNLNRDLFEPVYFGYDSSTVSPNEAAKVEAVAQYLMSNSGGVVVEGHGDERGSRDYNLALGERRALAVREYLIGLGVAPDVVMTNSKGEEEPAAMGHDEGAWQLNRRAVFGVYE